MPTPGGLRPGLSVRTNAAKRPLGADRWDANRGRDAPEKNLKRQKSAKIYAYIVGNGDIGQG